jgi:hypothetical protein
MFVLSYYTFSILGSYRSSYGVVFEHASISIPSPPSLTSLLFTWRDNGKGLKSRNKSQDQWGFLSNCLSDPDELGAPLGIGLLNRGGCSTFCKVHDFALLEVKDSGLISLMESKFLDQKCDGGQKM